MPEVPPASFSMSGSAPDVKWQVTNHDGYDAATDAAHHQDPARLWYTSTDQAQQNYQSDASNQGTWEDASNGSATSPTIHVLDATATPQIYFSSRYEVESDDPSVHDQMLV